MYLLKTNITGPNGLLEIGSVLSRAELDGVDIESHLKSGNIERQDVLAPDKAKVAQGKIKDLEELATSLQNDCAVKDERIAELEKTVEDQADQIRELEDAKSVKPAAEKKEEATKTAETEPSPRDKREKELRAKEMKRDDLIKIATDGGHVVDESATKEQLIVTILDREFPAVPPAQV